MAKAKSRKSKPRRKKVIPGVEVDDSPKLFRFTVDGKVYELDVNPDHLSARERIGVEDYLGMPWIEAAMSGWLASQKALTFLAHLAMARKDENATFDDVLDAEELLVEEVTPDDRPTAGSSGTSTENPDDSGTQS